MPTLAEYEARGIDITHMSQEQLQAEGYVTPMNELPVVVDGPGGYYTRNGRFVQVTEVRPLTTLSSTAFTVYGYVHVVKPTKKVKTKGHYWHVSGRCDVFREKSWDLVKKGEKP